MTAVSGSVLAELAAFLAMATTITALILLWALLS